MKYKGLVRIDDVRLRLENKKGIPVNIFARPEVPIEKAALKELESLLKLQDTIELLRTKSPSFFGGVVLSIVGVAVTPDFHKGAGIPIGTVLVTKGFIVPQAIGNDINCGMRLLRTDYTESDLDGRYDELEKGFRHTFFEGGRDIAMNKRERAALIQNGIIGLFEAVDKKRQNGLWRLFHELVSWKDIEPVDFCGSLAAAEVDEGFDNFLGDDELSRDAQIGSIGGGNHFVEIQVVDKIYEGRTAACWGLKKGQIVIMIHSGSVGIGHYAGLIVRQETKAAYPAGVPHPPNWIYPLPDDYSKRTKRILNVIYNAANFAFGNRLFLGLMAIDVLRKIYGRKNVALLRDAPHNLIWRSFGKAEIIHRKGACSARGIGEMLGEFNAYGEPVLVPGSMGSSSFILAGRGCADSFSSASHGAGRKMSRGDALKYNEEEFMETMRHLRVVTPVDFNRPDIKMRRDIVAKKMEEIKKEAPFAYKGIGPVVETLSQAGIAEPVVELRPVMTVKG